MTTERKYTGLEIAITGISCQVPGAANWRVFWENLKNGLESIHFMTEQEQRDLGIDDHIMQNSRYVPAVATIPEKHFFDAAFFDYTPMEATLMNPVHRVLHQSVWEALEDANCNPDTLKGLIGIYVGSGDDANWRLYSRLKNSERQDVDSFSLNNINNKDFLASLLAYKLNFKGPAYSINTTCSTSLVAINQACKSLLLGETRVALAGGITIRTEMPKGYFFQEGMIFSSDGHCRAFDKDATGTFTSEGVGMVVLKRLNDAIEDGDHIHAIIKGGSINNDGNRKVGFTSTSVEGQVDCIRKAHKFSKVSPESISYVEAHGTGTRLGDPIEVEALNIAFNKNKDQRCALGSVKTNIGHLDTAAGVAGLIKTVLCLQHRQLVPSLHFKEWNPEIDFAGGPFFVNTSLQPWEGTPGEPLRAGVSSFGIGGTNAHTILEEAPAQMPGDGGRKHKLLVVSAKTAGSAERYLSCLRDFLVQNPCLNVADMAYTLQAGRKEFAWRSTISFTDQEDLQKQLQAPPLIHKNTTRSSTLVFLFPGQGSQYKNMSFGLYEEEAGFREYMDAGFKILQELTGTDMKSILFNSPEAGLVNDTVYTQPLLFLVEYSLSKLLISLGITPQYMIGHSIGEYVAACLSGVFSFEDALRLVVKRAELMGRVASGVMLSVPLSARAAAALVTEEISMAAVNGPEQVVLSGDPVSMAGLRSRLEAAGVAYVQLHTSHAFHSGMQDSILPVFLSAVQQVKLNRPQLPFMSNLTGDLIKESEACSAQYWVDHLRHTVQFSSGIEKILSLGSDQVFIEVGAGHSLSSLVKQHRPSQPLLQLNLLPGIRVEAHDHSCFLSGLGTLWRHGISIDWDAYHKGSSRRRISLPTYSFERLRYPVEVDPLASGLLSVSGHSPSGSGELKDWVYYPLWKRGLPSIEQGIAQSFLLLGGPEDFRIRLAEQLQSHGHAVFVVSAGSGYRQLSGTHYEASPLSLSDQEAVLTAVQSGGATITDIVYSYGLEAGYTEKELYLSLSGIARALVNKGMMKERRIAVLTDSLHQVHGDENTDPGSSIVLGLVNVLPQEYAVNTLNIDMVLKDPAAFKYLVKELTGSWSRSGRIVALRGSNRWLSEYEQNRAEVSPVGKVLRQGGLYLVTGGLGNVGYVLSSYLQEHYGARLVLTGRQPLASLSAAAATRYDALRSSGTYCSYYGADVADEDSLLSVVEEIEGNEGHIDGIIHTAGVIDERYFELIGDTTPAGVEQLFSAKVTGIRSVEKVFRSRQPDFVWVSSSLSSVLGGLGFGAYASANIYMDHFILSQASGVTRWRSVCLGGMAFSADQIKREQGRHRSTLKPEELGRLFEWSLESNSSAVLVQTVESLSARQHRVYEVKKEAYLDEADQERETLRTERPALATGYVAPVTETEQRLAEIFEQFFGIDRIGIEDNFFELGGDSLKGMMLLKRVKNEFMVNITLTDFFQHQTVGKLSLFISDVQVITLKGQRTSKMVI